VGEKLKIRLTHRTERVLAVIAENPGASSLEVAEAAGIKDKGQASKLLARLATLELIENTAESRGTGQAKAWRLTELGVELRRARLRGRG
jgi:chromosome segregation and condensation protein ScpB